MQTAIQPHTTGRNGRTFCPARKPGVSAVVPARNEADCIAAVVSGLLGLRDDQGAPLLLEVVVADNGSSDHTAAIATAAGARVVAVPVAGYGQACWHGVQASLGDVLLFVDGDGAAAPADAPKLLKALEEGAQLAIGIRAHPEPDSMSLSQTGGNALASALMRLIWRMPASDLGPYRAIERQAFDRLAMQDRGFGWTVEMQVRAHRLGLRVAEREVGWHRRAGGHSKISGTWRGVFGAGVGILGMIARLWWRERHRQHSERPARPQEARPPN